MTKITVKRYNRHTKYVETYEYELKGQPNEINVDIYTVNPLVTGININGVKIYGELVTADIQE